MAEFMLTTIDNPYNPFTDYDDWYAYDHANGYHCPSYLARVARTSDELSEADQAQALDLAIEDIIRENVNGMYTKVYAPEGTQT